MAGMDLPFFLKGLIFGFSVAAPVGPIGVLCIRRSLTGGWRAGLLTGTGAATADAVYGCIAAFGLAGVTGILVGHTVWIQLVGGLFLCGLGLNVLFSKSDPAPAAARVGTGAMGYLSAFLLTLTNPMTILSFTAVFAGMGLGEIGTGTMAAGWLVAGVFSGSMTWWIILSSAAGRFKRATEAGSMGWINRISGVVLTAFGVAAVIGQL